MLVLYYKVEYFTELESQIEQLRDTQRKYLNILRLTRVLTSHFYHVVQSQVIILFVDDKQNSQMKYNHSLI